MASSLCRSKSHCPTTCERTRTHIYIYSYTSIDIYRYFTSTLTRRQIHPLIYTSIVLVVILPLGNITKSTRRPCRHQAWSQCCHRRGVKSGGEKEWDLELFGWGMEVHMIWLSIIFLELLWLCKCLIALSFQCIIAYYSSFFDHKITYTTCILCIHTQICISQFEIMFLILSFQVSIFFLSIGDVTMAGHCLWKMCHQVIAPTDISSERCSLRHTSCVFHQNQMYLIHRQWW